MARTRIGFLTPAAVVLGLSGLSIGAAPQAREQASVAAPGRSRVVSSLVGVARAVDGRALEGIVVSARALERSYTTSVFTDEQGEYVFPPLDGGQYEVWAQAVGFETARAKVSVETARQTRQAFTLNTIKDVTPHVSGSEWLAALPEDTREQRRMKEIFRTNCTACHGPTHALQNRFDENGWRAVIMFMERMTGTDGINRHTTIVHYRDELARYLAAVRGPSSPPLKFKLQPRPRGDAARVVITEFDVPLAGARTERAWNDGSDWSQGWPTASMGARWIHDVHADNDGNAWGTRDRGPADMTLFKVNTKTGQVTGFSVKNGQATRRSPFDHQGPERHHLVRWRGRHSGPARSQDGSVRDVHASAEHGRRTAHHG
jgi:mono/diheme cytochrome c family protein